MRLVARRGMDDRVDGVLAQHPMDQRAIDHRSDDRSGGTLLRVEPDDPVVVARSRGTKVWPSQPDEPVTRMFIADQASVASFATAASASAMAPRLRSVPTMASWRWASHFGSL